jgi:thiosulfate dehydrogenase
MKAPHALRRTHVLAGIATAMLLGFHSTSIADQVQLESGPLSDAVHQGEKLFKSETFGGNGKTCNACHPDGGRSGSAFPDGKKIPSLNNAAAIFPRHHARTDRIFTMSDQVRHCISEMKGKPPEYGSPALNALVTYVSTLSEGQTIDMGGRPK